MDVVFPLAVPEFIFRSSGNNESQFPKAENSYLITFSFEKLTLSQKCRASRVFVPVKKFITKQT